MGEEQAKTLEESLQNEDSQCFDGLVVLVSCHGDDGVLWTSDYRTILKQDVHRIFSSLPLNRQIPRIFIFGSCSGNKDREQRDRQTIDEHREQYGPDAIEL